MKKSSKMTFFFSLLLTPFSLFPPHYTIPTKHSSLYAFFEKNANKNKKNRPEGREGVRRNARRVVRPNCPHNENKARHIE